MTLSAGVGGQAIEISCETTKAKSEDEGKSLEHGLFLQPKPLGTGATNYLVDATLNFSACRLGGTLGEKCKIPAEKSTVELIGEPKSGTKSEDIIFKPATGTTLIGMPFEEKNKCPATIKGEKKVTGEQLCEWKEAEVSNEEHLLECNKNSGLLFAENEAHLTFDSLILPTNLSSAWEIVETA